MDWPVVGAISGVATLAGAMAIGAYAVLLRLLRRTRRPGVRRCCSSNASVSPSTPNRNCRTSPCRPRQFRSKISAITVTGTEDAAKPARRSETAAAKAKAERLAKFPGQPSRGCSPAGREGQNSRRSREAEGPRREGPGATPGAGQARARTSRGRSPRRTRVSRR